MTPSRASAATDHRDGGTALSRAVEPRLCLRVHARVVGHLDEERLVGDVLHAVGAHPARAYAAERHQRRAVVAELVEERRLGDADAAAVDPHAAELGTQGLAHRDLEAVHDAHVVREDDQLPRWRCRSGRGDGGGGGAGALRRGARGAGLSRGGGSVAQRTEAAVEPALGTAQLDCLEQTHPFCGRLDASLVQRVATLALRLCRLLALPNDIAIHSAVAFVVTRGIPGGSISSV
eukprot:scaffold92048_cov69-Phaeocystis_antarctica.AAC.4